MQAYDFRVQLWILLRPLFAVVARCFGMLYACYVCLYAFLCAKKAFINFKETARHTTNRICLPLYMYSHSCNICALKTAVLLAEWNNKNRQNWTKTIKQKKTKKKKIGKTEIETKQNKLLKMKRSHVVIGVTCM